MKQNRTRSTMALLVTVALCCGIITAVQAHDEGHKRPDKLPPIGPHGGSYSKLTKHFAEVVVKGKLVTVYILERDVKHVAEDATKISLVLEIPGKSTRKVKLRYNKKAKGYEGRVVIPGRSRRVYFHVRCVLDRKWEKGRILYEPRR